MMDGKEPKINCTADCNRKPSYNILDFASLAQHSFAPNSKTENLFLSNNEKLLYILLCRPHNPDISVFSTTPFPLIYVGFGYICENKN
jgi:hypothetical protein